MVRVRVRVRVRLYPNQLHGLEVVVLLTAVAVS
jgi:hypothetical protein